MYDKFYYTYCVVNFDQYKQGRRSERVSVCMDDSGSVVHKFDLYNCNKNNF